ncbi:MAG TPA: glycoside hydrolase family 9 protein, partial [Hyphomicrobiaceae bacterium]|nr:glycoside hydrolase family 9 protein [Hyphomicrobiaceae bacterium]
RYGHAPAKAAVENTLTHICQGGIYDHLGGGFARYSVDAYWLVPHFEKMLYDNALLIDLMTEVYRETRNPLFRLRVEETVGWLQHEMLAEGGGFAASLDADSEGEEGRFYVWSAAEIAEVLGPDDARFFGDVYGVKPEGNWEGHNILNRLDHLTLKPEAQEGRLAQLRSKLKERRATRTRPGWDDKVLADWNGLAIAALAHAARVFVRNDWLEMAKRAFAFVDAHMTVAGRLIHSYRAGQRGVAATASDYANMIWSALRLYQATNDDRYLGAARRWTEILDRHYWDQDSGGGYTMTADDARDVIVRLKSAQDDATPNANAIMISNLVQLFMLTGDNRYFERAESIPHAFATELNRSLIGHAGVLANCIDLLAPQHIVIVGGEESRDSSALADALVGLSLPGATQQVLADAAHLPASSALSGKKTLNGKATAYVCIGPQCSPPITDAAALSAALRDQRMARWASA